MSVQTLKESPVRFRARSQTAGRLDGLKFNAMPVAAANRIGVERELDFYGSSFICDQRGDIQAELGRDEEGVRVATFDREALRRYRASWGFFRDRRPDLYDELTSDEPPD